MKIPISNILAKNKNLPHFNELNFITTNFKQLIANRIKSGFSASVTFEYIIVCFYVVKHENFEFCSLKHIGYTPKPSDWHALFRTPLEPMPEKKKKNYKKVLWFRNVDVMVSIILHYWSEKATRRVKADQSVSGPLVVGTDTITIYCISQYTG